MSSLFALSPNSKRLLFLKKFDLYTLYRLPLLFASVVLFLSSLLSVCAFANGTMVKNDVPQLTGSSYLLARCNNGPDNDIYYLVLGWWGLKCNTLFLEPVVKGKALTKYAQTYYPAKYCPASSSTAAYQVEMAPKPYTVVQSCIPPWK